MRIFKSVRLGIVHLWGKIVHSLHEIVMEKCDLSRGLDPRDVGICTYLSFPLRDGVPLLVSHHPGRRAGYCSQRVNHEGH